MALFFAVGELHLHDAARFQERFAPDVVDLVFLEEELDARRVFVGDIAGTGDDFGPVEAEAVEFEPELCGPLVHRLEQLGIAQESFGGDATPVQAGAARAFLFNTRHFFTELGRANRADIPRRASADDNQVVVHRMIKDGAVERMASKEIELKEEMARLPSGDQEPDNS